MDEFDLDLGAIEQEIDASGDGRVVLGVLDGKTPGEEWLREVLGGSVLVLAIAGDLNELASDFAREVKDRGGSLVHFRDFLVVAPPEVDVDTDRL